MPGVRDDQRRLRVAVDERAQAVGDRRQAAAAVDQDRHAALGRELEDRREPLVAGVELLGARVQLDAAGAGVEAAARLLDRRLVQVEPHERDQPAARCARRRRASGRSRRVNAGCRSGSSRQNMNAREIPYAAISASSWS